MEMIWTYIGLRNKSWEWGERKDAPSIGMTAYAAKQEAMWGEWAEKAKVAFGLDHIE
jgi:hypothetical protein